MYGKPVARYSQRAFTLVELLVVISVIVILLALLVPALSKALKASEKAKCAANQRNIAQVLTGYSINNKYQFVPSVAGYSATRADNDQAGDSLYVTQGDFAYAMDYRASGNINTVGLEWDGPAYANRERTGGLSRFVMAYASADTPGGGNQAAPKKPLGLGILVAIGALPSTKLGEIAHCPSLNTSSAAPTPKYGMDETYAIASGTTKANSAANGAGGSYFVDPAQLDSRIVGSYHYRGPSFALKRGGNAVIQYSQVGPAFVLTTDLLDVRFGRKFHHKDGYNVSYGDGSCRYYDDQPTEADPRGATLERIGKIDRMCFDNPNYNATTKSTPLAVPVPIDGVSSHNPDDEGDLADFNHDERIFEALSKPRSK